MSAAYTIQANGKVTLPKAWRDKYGLKDGDVVAFVETEAGLLVLPREMVAMQALDRIGQALKEQGLSLEDLMEAGREIRQDIYNERYAD